ncbi:hypothetical protein OIB37_26475 [Streptomyces sp. NBC_00820]|uniref:hypothetical protein n=1 Tax=Streptomyces sp. NBC_00820 TaxID=2975842 RepID=UPI002ED4437A|nr:hypothetical protein OIB37_26475 [Streptomyces sp. NBC_00820]
MSPTPSSTRARLGLAVSLLLPTAFLGACSVLGGEGCHGTDPELKRLAAQPLFDAAPARATAPANYRGVGVTTGCDDDSSGKPWLRADRVYTFAGERGDVIAHYAKVARAQGWAFEHDPSPDASSATVEGACWTRTEKGRHLLLNVDFRPDGASPAPEAGSGILYWVSVGTTPDGSDVDGEVTCWH